MFYHILNTTSSIKLQSSHPVLVIQLYVPSFPLHVIVQFYQQLLGLRHCKEMQYYYNNLITATLTTTTAAYSSPTQLTKVVTLLCAVLVNFCTDDDVDPFCCLSSVQPTVKLFIGVIKFMVFHERAFSETTFISYNFFLKCHTSDWTRIDRLILLHECESECLENTFKSWFR